MSEPDRDQAVQDLELDLSKRIEFLYEELLDPDDPLAQWVANLARALNDILLTNRRLATALAGEPGQEAIYDMRAVATHAWELAKFLREADAPAVREFITALPKPAREDYEKALTALAEPEPGASEKSFKSLLASARDQATHYSSLDHKLLRRALKELQTDLEGNPKKGVLFLGETFKDFYAEFGSELDYQLFFSDPDPELNAFKQFVTQLNQVVGYLIRFAVTAVHVYLHEHRSQIETSDLEHPPGQETTPTEGSDEP